MERNARKQPADRLHQLRQKNAKLEEEYRKVKAEMTRIERERSILNRIAAIFLTAPDEEMYANALTAILEATESKFGLFGFIAENGDLVIPSLTRDVWRECQIPDKSTIFPKATWGDSVWARAIKEQRAFNSQGPFRMPHGHVHIDNCLAVPILYRDETIGLLVVANRRQGYSEDEKVLMESVAAGISPILNARLQREQEEKERRSAEEALYKREQEFRTLAERSPDFIVRLGEDGRILYANPSMNDLAKVPVSEVLGKNVADKFPLFTGGRIIVEKTMETLKTGSGSTVEILIDLAPGAVPACHQIRLVPEHDPTGRVVSVLAIGRDITALKETERQLSTLLEHFPDAIVRLDTESRFVYVSPNAEEIVGEPREQLIGRTVDEIHLEALHGSQSLPDLIEDVFRHGVSNTCEAVKSSPQGEKIFDIRHVPEFDYGGTVKSVLGICRDVTERKMAERDRLAHLRFFESMDRVNRAIRGNDNLEQMVSDVLDAVLLIFECDRAWLFYPADPEAESWSVPMERTRPEYPGALARGTDLTMNPHTANVIRAVRNSPGPVKFGPGGDYPLPPDFSVPFDFKSFIARALYPKIDKPWMFGLHQCSYPRIWTLAEERLFEAIARRLTDGLTSLLVFHDIQKSERRQRFALQIGRIGILEADLESGHGTWTAETEQIWGNAGRYR